MNQEIFADKPKNPKGPWDVAIIGSGPAGLTAGIYTTRGAVSTIVFGGETWGGQLMLTGVVDNYPGFPKGILGSDLMQSMRDQTVRFGGEFLQKTVSAVDLDKKPFEITAGGENYTARTIIIATGAETNWLKVPGEKKLIGKGVSSCAPCDAPFFKNKKVAVVGGGDSAMEEALVLSKYATEVTIIHRRDNFRASAAMQKKVMDNPKIKKIWDTEVIEALGQDKITALKLKNSKTGETSEFPVDGMFVAIGHSPSSGIFSGKIDLDEKGYIKIMDGSRTNVPGVFVSGDVHDHRYKQAVTAAGFGCQAALDTLTYLDEIQK